MPSLSFMPTCLHVHLASILNFCVRRNQEIFFTAPWKPIDLRGFAGMADPLSFVLGNGGYRAYKYVPWGRVEEVMPYLIRRAQVHSSTRAITMETSAISLYVSFFS